MQHHKSSAWNTRLNFQPAPRVAVIGGGIAGLTCARELVLRGCEPVVFEASGRLGGRCSSRNTRIGLFDDGAQSISGATRLAAYALQHPGELAALHPWTVAATPAEEDRAAKGWKKDEDEADVTRTLKLLGAVGVPSMAALAQTLSEPLDTRLNTPILQAQRQGGQWILSGLAGPVDEDFQALVLAVPAPLALPLAMASPELSQALRAVRYRSRWVLLLGSERPVALPGYREFQGSPIERVAAMHSKPGRSTSGHQRWFIEADERWSLQHEHDDAETVADLLLDIFRAHAAGRSVSPSLLQAQQWQHAFVQTPAITPSHSECLWDDAMRLGVCGDSVVTSQVDRVHRSGVDMARTLAEGLAARHERSAFSVRDPNFDHLLEAQL